MTVSARMTAMRSWIVAVLLFGGDAAVAQGLAAKDLTAVAPAVVAALGKGFEIRSAPKRLIASCPSCAGGPIVDIALGEQTDGTEGRVRSGATSIAELERLCRMASPTCRVTALDVAPAIGWVSGYPLGETAGATAVIVRDGDLLTIRSLAGDPAAARSRIDRLLPVVRARIVGRQRAPR